MSDSKHKKTYMHKTSKLLAKNNNFQSVQLHVRNRKTMLSQKTSKIKTMEQSSRSSSYVYPTKSHMTKNEISDQYIKLKDKRKNEIRAFKKKQKSIMKGLDSQLLKSEKALDDTKMFETVKFLKPQKTNKIACEMVEVKSHFMNVM